MNKSNEVKSIESFWHSITFSYFVGLRELWFISHSLCLLVKKEIIPDEEYTGAYFDYYTEMVESTICPNCELYETPGCVNNLEKTIDRTFTEYANFKEYQGILLPAERSFLQRGVLSSSKWKERDFFMKDISDEV